jgi:endonuclease/exonuclease/phosphatase family metal-dependent hydrolase
MVSGALILSSALLLVSSTSATLAPLCTPPAEGSDDAFISCQVETDSHATNYVVDPAVDPNKLVIVEYNIDRNGEGGDGDNEQGLDPIINLLSTPDAVPEFDILFISEVARGCDSWTGGASGAQEIAAHFGFHFAYAVEYVEYNMASAIGECSIGNAVVSRYPLADVESFTFEKQCCRYGGRWGGRSTVCGTVTPTGSSKLARVCSTHLESGQPDFKSVMEGTYVRERQASELSKKLKVHESSASLLVLGGDMNSPLRSVDPTRLAYEFGGFSDVHDSMDWSDRGTAPDEAGGKIAVPLDMVYTNKKGSEVEGSVGICNQPDLCNGFSDHVPIYATLNL